MRYSEMSEKMSEASEERNIFNLKTISGWFEIPFISTAGSCYGPKKAEAGQEPAAYYNHSHGNLNAGVFSVHYY
jgi:hypothetical protein